MIFVPIMIMIAAYLAFSWLLFFFPTLINIRHKYPKNQLLEQALEGTRVLKIAHRGGPRARTENTIESFELALLNSDMLEMDVCETKDGVLVVHHDHSLQRTCGVKTFIRDLQFKDLPKFKEDIKLDFAPEGMTVCSKGEKIPTLQQVFKRFPDVTINLEIKTPSKEAIKSLVKLINTYNRRHLTIVGTRDDSHQDLRAADRKLMTFMNDKEFYFYLISLVTGLLPYLYISASTMQTPLWTKQYQDWKFKQTGADWKTRLFFYAMRYIGNPLMKILSYHFQKRGILTFYWVCNYDDDFRRAISYGANGIMTDNPATLSTFIEKYHKKADSEQPLQVPVCDQDKEGGKQIKVD